MMKYSLDEQTINEVLAYLGEKPYKEVAHLIEKVKQNAEKIDIIKKKDKRNGTN